MKHIGNLEIRTRADAKKYAGVTEVTGHISLWEGAKLELPNATSVGGYISLREGAKLEAPRLYAKGFAAFKVFDGIPCAVISTKSKDGVEILNCRRAQIKDGKIVGDRFIIAKRGDVTAHATTIKEALEELAFKTGSRDVEQYRSMPLTTRKAPKAWASIYRQITGACQFGTQDFMARRKLKKSYTLKEILKETKGAFGHETFRDVVSP